MMKKLEALENKEPLKGGKEKNPLLLWERCPLNGFGKE
jgi:hypothetical protein